MLGYGLSFMDDGVFYHHVKETVEKYRFNINLADFNKNLIGPIKLTFDSKIYQRNIQQVIEEEALRQIDKSNTNHIGYFHQNIFHHIGNGWSVPKEGYDVVNKDKKIYVEIKNKHNTMNSSSSQKTYMRMQHTIIKDPEARCLLVEVIAKDSQNRVWECTVDKQKVYDERIRRVSIDQFYRLVTNKEDAFKEMCEALPKAIDDVLKHKSNELENNTVIKELSALSPNLLKSLYLLSFEKYAGFNEINI